MCVRLEVLHGIVTDHFPAMAKHMAENQVMVETLALFSNLLAASPAVLTLIGHDWQLRNAVVSECVCGSAANGHAAPFVRCAFLLRISCAHGRGYGR